MDLPSHPHALPATLLLCLLAGCRGPADGDPTATGAPPEAVEASVPAAEILVSDAEEEASEEELRWSAIERIRGGDYEGARTYLDGLLIEDYLEHARKLLDRNQPEDGLTLLDKALEMDPRHLEARLLKADGSLMLAEKVIAERGFGLLIESSLEDALEYYKLSGESAHALLGASRAAYLLGRSEEALDFARRGMRLTAGISEAELARLPQRTLSEAAYGAYTKARLDEAEEEIVRERYGEALEALASLLGHTPDDPWVWWRLSDLYEWEGKYATARRELSEALLRLPEEPGLLQRLARVSRLEGGSESVIEVFDDYVERNPSVSLGHWYLAAEIFELELQRLEEEERADPLAFARAEREFRRCRELDPGYTTACFGYEVTCRGARGWCAFYADELETATIEFLQMNDLFERGIEWHVLGGEDGGARMRSGIDGLFSVADQYNNRQNWLAAGEVFETLHRLQPEEDRWANNAGFFLRDAAVDQEADAKRLCRAANGELAEEATLEELRRLAGIDDALAGTLAEKLRFAQAANELLVEAQKIMERSWTAYEEAARLAPEDIRIVNDAALVLVYYLHTNLEQAERMLLECVALGTTQIAELEAELAGAELTAERREDLEADLLALEEAWGDAFQNLGVLEFVHRGNDARAEKYIEKAVEIGPDPRPDLTNTLLRLIRGQGGVPADNMFSSLESWAKPCRIR